MDQEVLFEEPLVVVAGMENPWARRRKIKLAELVNEPWTWPPGAAFDARVVEAFRASGLEPPRATVYAEAINMRTKLAANGRFLAVVPAYIMRFPAKYPSLKVLPVEFPTTHRQRDHHAQEPDAEPAGAALHRMRARDRKAAGKGPNTGRPSQEYLGPQFTDHMRSAPGPFASFRAECPGSCSPKPDTIETHADAIRRKNSYSLLTGIIT